MTSESLSTSPDDFFRIAEDLVMLTRDEALIVAEAVRKSGQSPEQVALQKGFLSAAQVDIIETLRNPRDTVPGYEILDVLGQGGMGVVYRARQINLNRIVALKAILLSRMSDKSAVGRFEQEAQTVGKLRHPNIVAAYDFGRHEGRLFLAMELVDGEDVDALLKDEGRFDEPTAWGLARQTAAGLAHAHRLGVVHRDIKPANLLLVEPPEGFPLPHGLPMVKIADFGLAFLADDQQVHTRLTSDNSAVGSPHYMAPEQLTDMDVDFRADIYALGATVYHMLSGRPPYGGLNLSQIIAQKLAGDTKPLRERCPDVSDATCRLVERMLARDPEDRPADYQSLMTEIDQLGTAGETTSTAHPTASPAMSPTEISSDAQGVNTDIVSTQDTQTMPTGNPAADMRSAPSVAHPARQHRLLKMAVAAAVLIAVGAGVWRFGFAPSAPSAATPPQPVAMRRSGWPTALFNGKSISEWIPGHGNWIVDAGEEGAHVIAGTDGEIAQTLFHRSADGKPVPIRFYRLELIVHPHQATAVEVRFGFRDIPTRDGPGYAVRFAPNGVRLGERPSPGDGFVPLSEPQSLSRNFQSRHSIVIERQPTGWFVTVDGEPLPGLPRRPEGELPEFRLAAESGPAWFSDLFVDELMPVANETGTAPEE